MFMFFFSFDHDKRTKGKLCSCSWQQIPSILPFDKRLNIYGHFKTMTVMYCLLEKLKLGIEVELCSCYYSSMCQSRTYSCIFCQLFFLGGQKLLSSYVCFFFWCFVQGFLSFSVRARVMNPRWCWDQGQIRIRIRIMSMIRIMIRSTIRSRSMIRNNACNSVVCSVVIYYYSSLNIFEKRKK